MLKRKLRPTEGGDLRLQMKTASPVSPGLLTLPGMCLPLSPSLPSLSFNTSGCLLSVIFQARSRKVRDTLQATLTPSGGWGPSEVWVGLEKSEAHSWDHYKVLKPKGQVDLKYIYHTAGVYNFVGAKSLPSSLTLRPHGL